MQSSSSTSLLNSSSSHMPTPKNWESAFGKLSSSYGFSGSVPSLPKKSSKSPKPSSTSTSSQSLSSTSSRSSMSSVPSTSTRSSVLPPPKDYESSFGHLSSSYGFGGTVPSLPPKTQKQPKRSVSPSQQPTVVRPSTGKDFGTPFAQLSSSYGFGGSSVSSMSSRR
ncbi:hypothetical protein GALMADRAFT_250668 [Galerina marginata CBS 339.88]|uniref:Uncharacterized protein n=1 Tax=Galerina marginata (strain CBS 339.88) TaxID=685588 RepID=A0A067SVA5_GALM3|nr:hypothetical protein GALMADRAFT_250668 [Galerina marginata CBS 339.88]